MESCIHYLYKCNILLKTFIRSYMQFFNFKQTVMNTVREVYKERYVDVYVYPCTCLWKKDCFPKVDLNY